MGSSRSWHQLIRCLVTDRQKGAKEFSQAFFIKALNPIHEGSTLMIQPPPKDLPPNIITFRALAYEFGGGGQTFSSQQRVSEENKLYFI